MIDNTDLWLAMRQTKYNRTLSKVNELLQNSDVDSLVVVENTLGLIAEAMHAETGTMWIHQKLGDGRIYPIAVFEGTLPEDFSIAPGEGLAGKVTETGNGVIVSDCQSDPRWEGKADAKTGFITRSMMCLPMSTDKECIGCMQIINKTDGLLFDDEDFDLADQLSKGVTKLLVDRNIVRKFQLGKELKRETSFNEVFLAESEGVMLSRFEEIYAYAVLNPRQKKKASAYARKLRQLFLEGIQNAKYDSEK